MSSKSIFNELSVQNKLSINLTLGLLATAAALEQTEKEIAAELKEKELAEENLRNQLCEAIRKMANDNPERQPQMLQDLQGFSKQLEGMGYTAPKNKPLKQTFILEIEIENDPDTLMRRTAWIIGWSLIINSLLLVISKESFVTQKTQESSFHDFLKAICFRDLESGPATKWKKEEEPSSDEDQDQSADPEDLLPWTALGDLICHYQTEAAVDSTEVKTDHVTKPFFIKYLLSPSAKTKTSYLITKFLKAQAKVKLEKAIETGKEKENCKSPMQLLVKPQQGKTETTYYYVVPASAADFSLQPEDHANPILLSGGCEIAKFQVLPPSKDDKHTLSGRTSDAANPNLAHEELLVD